MPRSKPDAAGPPPVWSAVTLDQVRACLVLDQAGHGNCSGGRCLESEVGTLEKQLDTGV